MQWMCPSVVTQKGTGQHSTDTASGRQQGTQTQVLETWCHSQKLCTRTKTTEKSHHTSLDSVLLRHLTSQVSEVHKTVLATSTPPNFRTTTFKVRVPNAIECLHHDIQTCITFQTRDQSHAPEFPLTSPDLGQYRLLWPQKAHIKMSSLPQSLLSRHASCRTALTSHVNLTFYSVVPIIQHCLDSERMS